jgi:hypothetical protein
MPADVASLQHPGTVFIPIKVSTEFLRIIKKKPIPVIPGIPPPQFTPQILDVSAGN